MRRHGESITINEDGSTEVEYYEDGKLAQKYNKVSTINYFNEDGEPIPMI